MSRPSRFIRLTAFGVGLSLGLLALAQPSLAQSESPRPPRPAGPQLDGYSSRFIPPRTVLPPDRNRDHFYYGKRWGDRAPRFPNWICTSGLYGLPLPGGCTVSFAPYFQGTPGGSMAGKQCEPVSFRYLNNFLHPWRPVGGYYAGGSAVPIYDLDPLVPGPGPFPFPRLYKRQHFGG